MTTPFENLVAGTATAVGWGAIGPLPYLVRRLPFRLRAVIDSDPRLWGQTPAGVEIVAPSFLAGLNPRKTVVVPLPLESAARREIAATVATIGAFPILSVPPDPAGDQTLAAQLTQCLSVLREQASAHPAPMAGRRRAVLVLPRLIAGGAERQLCLLARGLTHRGWSVQLVVFWPPGTGAAALHPLLDGLNHDELAPARSAWHPPLAERTAGLPGSDTLLALLDRTPVELAHPTLVLYERMIEDRPDLVIGYLDQSLPALLAAAAAGVPKMLISARLLAPPHLPHYFPNGSTWYRAAYQALSLFADFRLSANSAAAAQSYRDWLALGPNRIAVVPNAVVAPAAGPDARARSRSAWGIGDAAPVIAGLFRLAPEKQPERFLDVVARVRDRRPDLRVLIAGDGPLAADLAAAVRARGLAATVTLTGAVADPTAILAAADLLLHVSSSESLPNAVLEAQAIGLPVVATTAGGTLEALAPALHAFARHPDDPVGLAEACLALLSAPHWASELGAAAGREILARFSRDAMTSLTLRAVQAGPTARDDGAATLPAPEAPIPDRA